MNTPASIPFRLSVVIGCFFAAVLERSAAQTPAALSLQHYPGLTITGAVGRVYAIEWTRELERTNSVSDWRCLEFLQLPANHCLWVDKAAPASARRFYRAEAFEPPAGLVFIPPGTMRMGSPESDPDRWEGEIPQTMVTISRGFWMGAREVSQFEFELVMGWNPSSFTGDPSRPVESVTWFEAAAYCTARTQQERQAGRIPPGTKYRLPTEAEWEYACRAWTSTRFSYGDDPGGMSASEYVWNVANSAGATQPVGQKLPNVWGLYDMHGNVWEWCEDWWGEYRGDSVIDPHGPPTGTSRVIRGGDWSLEASACRSACRYRAAIDHWSNCIGFRVVLAPEDQSGAVIRP